MNDSMEFTVFKHDGVFEVRYNRTSNTSAFDPVAIYGDDGHWRYYLNNTHNIEVVRVRVDIGMLTGLVKFCEHLTMISDIKNNEEEEK